jgi:hypothetical protein
VDEAEKPKVSLSEEESKAFQRILRNSRKDVESVEFDAEGKVTIKCKLTPILYVDYDEALRWTDQEWTAFWTRNRPLI